jgi:hypothetical protein
VNGRVDVGGVIRSTFEIYRDQFPVLIPAAAVVFVITGTLELAAEAANGSFGLGVRVVLGILTAPISALAMAVLYFQLLGGPSGEPVASAAPGGPTPPAQS